MLVSTCASVENCSFIYKLRRVKKMNINKCQFLIFALFLVNILEEVNSLRCFTCSLLISEDCRDPFDMENNAWGGECEHPDEVCMKVKTPATYIYQENIQRGCVYKNYCNNLETSLDSCFTCDTHLCNTSPTVRSDIALLSTIFCYVLQRLL